MNKMLATTVLIAAGLFAGGACAQSVPPLSHYLFVWAMEAQRPLAPVPEMTPADIPARRGGLGLGKDFLALFDVRPGPSFGKLFAMLPVGDAAQAHHTNYAEPPNDALYANDWLGNRTYVFDLHDPVHPRLVRKFGSVGALGYPHSFVIFRTATRWRRSSIPVDSIALRADWWSSIRRVGS
jgi:hypothetical protein